jgi:hypothetical protein
MELIEAPTLCGLRSRSFKEATMRSGDEPHRQLRSGVDDDPWAFLQAATEQLREARLRLEARLALARSQLVCVECGRIDPGDERGWTLRLDEDDDLAAFCPACDEREFGDA